MKVLKDLESMFGILDIGRRVPNQRCHNMIKITGDESVGQRQADTIGQMCLRLELNRTHVEKPMPQNLN